MLIELDAEIAKDILASCQRLISDWKCILFGDEANALAKAIAKALLEKVNR